MSTWPNDPPAVLTRIEAGMLGGRGWKAKLLSVCNTIDRFKQVPFRVWFFSFNGRMARDNGYAPIIQVPVVQVPNSLRIRQARWAAQILTSCHVSDHSNHTPRSSFHFRLVMKRNEPSILSIVQDLILVPFQRPAV